MTESTIKKRTLVIMDGSNGMRVERITELVDQLAKELFVKSTCEQLDKRHPTMLVISVVMTDERYEKLKELLETRYPGLCVYDPPME